MASTYLDFAVIFAEAWFDIIGPSAKLFIAGSA
jgi:hypothetical protein